MDIRGSGSHSYAGASHRADRNCRCRLDRGHRPRYYRSLGIDRGKNQYWERLGAMVVCGYLHHRIVGVCRSSSCRARVVSRIASTPSRIHRSTVPTADNGAGAHIYQHVTTVVQGEACWNCTLTPRSTRTRCVRGAPVSATRYAA